MTKRQSTGKRLRFEIFNRDHFTCQYCGAQPPGIVLVVDHVIPIVGGGSSEPINLLTACEPCNQGKADKRLGGAPVRPDADLLYLETQQEVAELRRYQDALALKEGTLKEVVADLQELWETVSGLDWWPADHVIRNLLNRYTPEVVESAIRDVGPKVSGGYVQGAWVGYLFQVAKRLTEEL